MSTFSFDDGGAVDALAADLNRAGVRAGVQAGAVVQRNGVKLVSRVKAHASGRPGPRIQTGDYNRSWSLEIRRRGGSLEAAAGTNRPQGPRLEFGFHGADSLGRHYDQPPLPHAGPALDETASEFEADIAAIADL